MSQSVTTSIRLEPRLRRALERKAREENRGKNWIISRALEAYLAKEGQLDLEAEARRQSLMASGQDAGDWVEAADWEDWK
jgi:predicted transcriptional regulator